MSVTVIDEGFCYTPRERGDSVYYMTLGGELLNKRVVGGDRTSHTYTVRDYHTWCWMEWIHSHWEEWVKWPREDRTMAKASTAL